MDLILAFPFLLMLLALSPVIIQRLDSIGITGNFGIEVYITMILSFFAWPYLARIVRGQVLSLREREFVEAAVSLGSGTPRILLKEILPNLWAPVLVYTSLLIPTFIAAEATVSFLGIGVTRAGHDVGLDALGLRHATSSSTRSTCSSRARCSSIVCLTFNLLGDAVRDALDPRAGRQ